MCRGLNRAPMASSRMVTFFRSLMMCGRRWAAVARINCWAHIWPRLHRCASGRPMPAAVTAQDISVNGLVYMVQADWISPAAEWSMNQALCDESAQAFVLLTDVGPCETDPPKVVSVAPDCDKDPVTVVYSEPMALATTSD